jgi:hypothetical protein
VAFLVLSLADWLLTRWLVGESGGAVEANPLAAGVLRSYGWAGLAAFKLAAVVGVLALKELVGRRRPAAGRRLCRLSCALLLALVGYHVGLAVLQPWDPEAVRTLAYGHQRDAEIAQGWRDLNGFQERLREQAAALEAGRVPLAAAVAALEVDLRTRACDPLVAYRIWFPAYNRQACLALALLNNLAGPDAPGQAARLAGEFETAYRRPLLSLARFRAVCGPGDDAEPVITVMMPDEH